MTLVLTHTHTHMHTRSSLGISLKLLHMFYAPCCMPCIRDRENTHTNGNVAGRVHTEVTPYTYGLFFGKSKPFSLEFINFTA